MTTDPFVPSNPEAIHDLGTMPSVPDGNLRFASVAGLYQAYKAVVSGWEQWRKAFGAIRQDPMISERGKQVRANTEGAELYSLVSPVVIQAHQRGKERRHAIEQQLERSGRSVETDPDALSRAQEIRAAFFAKDAEAQERAIRQALQRTDDDAFEFLQAILAGNSLIYPLGVDDQMRQVIEETYAQQNHPTEMEEMLQLRDALQCLWAALQGLKARIESDTKTLVDGPTPQQETLVPRVVSQ